LWQLLDGTHNLKDLVLLYFQKFHQFSPHAVAETVAGLVSAGFALGNMSRIDQTLIKKSFLGQWIKRMVALLQWKIMIENVDPFMKRAYSYSRWFFVWPTQIFLIFFNGAGLMAFYWQSSHIHPFLAQPAWTPDFFVLIPLALFSIFIHEMGHALTVKSFGRDVLSVGLGWHWISPIFYVDTSDMWLEKRWPRIAVSLAGPYAQLIFVNLVILVGFLISSQDLFKVIWIFSAVSYLIILLNLNPLLKYDGYYILQDLRASH
jgi:putative peptide zinc metalloprotease protein